MKKTFKQLQEFFEQEGFLVHPYEEDGKQCAEVEKWTDGGVDMLITLEPFTAEEFEEWVDGFDPEEEVELHRESRDYRQAFTMRQALDDFENFHNELMETVTKLKHS